MTSGCPKGGYQLFRLTCYDILSNVYRKKFGKPRPTMGCKSIDDDRENYDDDNNNNNNFY
jgi:hypothetical protein